MMRLRAEWLYASGAPEAITFYTEQGRRLNFREWMHQHPGTPRRASFDSYLITVFTYCSTRTLRRQLQPVASPDTIASGEVLIRAGSPGNAMLVAEHSKPASYVIGPLLISRPPYQIGQYFTYS
ncbi:MAG: hypothetical protein JST42_14365 [Bacteroidetes bacterium]|nr:hypothetical protein [Bacteroidota bacterium]